MPKRTVPITIPAYIARIQLGSILTQVAQKKARFIITKSGKPTAVLIGTTDFDDILEELDPEFQKSLRVASKEYQTGKAITLRRHLKGRCSGRRIE